MRYWFQHAKTNPRDWYVQVDLHGGEHSAVSARGRSLLKEEEEEEEKGEAEATTTTTAYAHRDRLLLYLFHDWVDGGRPYPADGHTYVENFVGNITEGMGPDDWGRYANYPDTQLDQAAAQADYWGANLPRLRAIKRAVDPDDLFHYPQGVLPA